MFAKKRGWTTASLFIISNLILTACSPGMFFGDGTDQDVLNTPTYRKINADCSGLNLSSPTMNVPQFRTLIKCFNSQGAIQAIQDLVQSLNDTDLKPIVDMSNRYILTNSKLLYQLEQTYYTLNDHGILDETLDQFGKLLENDEFIAATIGLIEEGYAQQPSSSLFSKFTGLFSSSATPPSPDMKLLRALEKLAPKLNR
ncbi:MAG: hypothetical protein ACXWP5_15395, partial [Bdellovibrionota bacterium]